MASSHEPYAVNGLGVEWYAVCFYQWRKEQAMKTKTNIKAGRPTESL